MNFSEVERESLTKEFEQISVKFEVDRLRVFLNENDADETLFSSEQGFYPSKTGSFSQKDAMNKTFGGNRQSGKYGRRSHFGWSGKENRRNQQNRQNRQNLVHPFVGVRDYGDYSGLKFAHFAQRKVPSAPFSERKLMLEMQR